MTRQNRPIWTLRILFAVLFFIWAVPNSVARPTETSEDREAATMAERAFAEEGQRFLKETIAHGTSKIGRLDLNDLLEKSKSIVWRVRTHGYMAGSGENRQTAEHLIEERQVTMSRESLRVIPWRSRPLVSLHETWGALGVEDESYQRTLGLFIYVYLRNELQDPAKFPAGFRDQIAAQFDAIHMRTQNTVYEVARVGGTSVGGGGDGTALDFKLALLLFGHPLIQKFPELFKGRSLDLLPKVLATNFEIDTDPANTSTTFENKDGKTIVRVSGDRWRSGYLRTDANPVSLDQFQMMLDTLRQLEAHK